MNKYIENAKVLTELGQIGLVISSLSGRGLIRIYNNLLGHTNFRIKNFKFFHLCENY